MKTDGSENQKIADDSDGSIENINIAGDWIFYHTNYIGIYRVRKDGTNKQLFVKRSSQ